MPTLACTSSVAYGIKTTSPWPTTLSTMTSTHVNICLNQTHNLPQLKCIIGTYILATKTKLPKYQINCLDLWLRWSNHLHVDKLTIYLLARLHHNSVPYADLGILNAKTSIYASCTLTSISPLKSPYNTIHMQSHPCITSHIKLISQNMAKASIMIITHLHIGLFTNIRPPIKNAQVNNQGSHVNDL